MKDDAPHDGGLDEELRIDAVDVLRDALQWRLAEPSWVRVADAVAALSAALRSGDLRALRAAVSEVELAGPVRATPVGGTSTVASPEDLREEIGELVHTLDGRSAAS